MSTYMPKAGDITRKWYVIDAAGKPMGKVAVEAEKAVLTGNKLDQKMYYHHTGYIGHLKEVKYSTLMRTRADFAMTLAVKGMIPDTVIGRKALTRLRVVKGAEHAHAAQKPEAWEF